MPLTEPFDLHVDEYDVWYDQHPDEYAAEVQAVRSLLPAEGNGLEIGAGSGRFMGPLGIATGVEPSIAMRARAESRGFHLFEGTAEALPFESEQFDFAVMITVDPFLDDLKKAFLESYRVLKPGGVVVVGLIDRESPAGRHYEARKSESPFYKDARFHSVREIASELLEAGYRELTYRQAVFGDPVRVVDGCGEGVFVAVRGTRLTW